MIREELVHDGWQRCPYLPERIARLPLYRQIAPLTHEEADERFESAERRMGRTLYRVACPTCSACRGIRVHTHHVQPTRSQRRVLRRWAKLPWRVEVGAPTVTAEKLALFHAHKRLRGLNGPDEAPLGPGEYESWLVQSCMDTIEMRYSIEGRLVGLGIVDLGSTSASSVYFYFDPAPEIARLSPGVFSVFQEAEFCRRTNREWLYLGLHVEDCRHLAYKADFAPHQLRIEGEWRESAPPNLR